MIHLTDHNRRRYLFNRERERDRDRDRNRDREKHRELELEIFIIFYKHYMLDLIKKFLTINNEKVKTNIYI